MRGEPAAETGFVTVFLFMLGEAREEDSAYIVVRGFCTAHGRSHGAGIRHAGMNEAALTGRPRC